MNSLYDSTYLPDILHDIAQGLLLPTMIIIVVLLATTLIVLGELVVETLSERRHYRRNMPLIVNEINNAPFDRVDSVVEGSGLLIKQKAALLTISRNMGLPEDALFSLAQTQVNKVDHFYKRRIAVSDVISKIGPMLGLMGTLIPLGPGIVSLKDGNTALLAQSLNIAFDATVCGLVCAVASLIVSKIRAGWYADYVESVESIATCILEKASQARAEGEVLPSNYTGDAEKELQRAAGSRDIRASEPDLVDTPRSSKDSEEVSYGA
ncbi:MotA/TolQ/ExbB proton channel family protein [Gordonibacter sp. Marseille-P4307]|uniref:MotA/TolQ/ExbB proton channel family protein n=1 Tax=Gordonibacter sp. Marseille-P4307 TaxID=2161815 RepID=UPI000F5489C2|nr:MotA/TolQ/ExbB proton channel family protein [Gordonibacter sp. Marseille-P4307]